MVLESLRFSAPTNPLRCNLPSFALRLVLDRGSLLSGVVVGRGCVPERCPAPATLSACRVIENRVRPRVLQHGTPAPDGQFLPRELGWPVLPGEDIAPPTTEIHSALE